MNVFAALIDPPKMAAAPQRKDTRFRQADPRRARKLRHLPRQRNPWNLTACQMEVLRLIVMGLTNGEIAAKLGLNIKTVEAHVQGLTGRMEAHVGEPINRVRAAVLYDRFARAANDDRQAA